MADEADFTWHHHVVAVDTEGRPVRTFAIRADDKRFTAETGFLGVAELEAEASGLEVLDVVEWGDGLALVVREA